MNQALPTTNTEAFGINLIGYFSGNIGLGVVARSIAALLQAKGVPFSAYDIPLTWENPQGGSKPQYDRGFTDHLVDDPGKLLHPVNLYAGIQMEGLQALLHANPALLAKGRMHIVNFWWEATAIPRHWLDMLARLDGILAMSDFIAETCRNTLALTPILYGECPLALPDNIPRDRREFGLADNAVVFVASFDPHSDPARKNPAGLITAFHNAFPASDADARLVIRINHATTNIGRQVVRHLMGLARLDSRITLLLEPMKYQQVLSLYACADVYLSFHRGEGLGLGMLESMALGKAVIATGWSGNLSFMNHGNSALLRYRLIPVSGNHELYRAEVIGPDARWADPVLEDAVAWMRKLRHDSALREAMGARAKRSAAEYQQRANEARWLLELQALWHARQFLPRVTGKLSFIDN